MSDLTLAEIEAEIARRQAGPSLADVEAEIARRSTPPARNIAPAGSPPITMGAGDAASFLSRYNPMLPGLTAPSTPESAATGLAQFDPMLPGMPRDIGTPFRNALEGWGNEIGGAVQRVHPGTVMDSYPVGPVIREGDSVYYVPPDSADRVEIPPSDFGRYVTMARDGAEWLYERTPEMGEGPLASMGRMLMSTALSPVAGATVAAARPASRAAGLAGDVLSGGNAFDAMHAQGVTPNLGMMGPTAARVDGVARGNILTAGVAERSAARALDDITRATERTAASAGTARTPAQAGAALQDSANAFLETTVKGENSIMSRLDGAVGARLSGERIPMNNTLRLLEEFSGALDSVPDIASEFGADRWRRWVSSIRENGGTLPWDQVRRLRSLIGEAQSRVSGPVADLPGGDLKRLYGALAEDMGSAARSAGPAAEAAWSRSNSFYRRAMDRIDNALGFLFKADSPEGAFSRFMSLTSDGSRANLHALREIKDSVTGVNGAWGEVISTVIRRMGAARPGGQDAAGEVFSPATFLTNWNRMSEGARRVMFLGDGAPPGLMRELDELGQIMERAKAAGIEINTPRSGVNLGNLAVITGGGGSAGTAIANVDPVHLLTTVGAMVTPNVMYRVFANPAVLRWVRNARRQNGPTRWAAEGLRLIGEHPDQAKFIQLMMREAGAEEGRPGPESGMLPAPAR